MSALQDEIQTRLAASEPKVEVLLVEGVAGSTLRLFIDHPDGVTLALCERVSAQLGIEFTIDVRPAGTTVHNVTKRALTNNLVGSVRTSEAEVLVAAR